MKGINSVAFASPQFAVLSESQLQDLHRAALEVLRRVPDGTYQASSPGYAGDVRIAVTVAGGRIQSVKVVHHQEKQFYSSLTETPQRIIEKQGVKGVDATSGATVTSEAIINATAKALWRGMRGR